MLAAPHRLRRSADFTAVVRGGVRSGRSALVVHLLLGRDAAPAEATDTTGRTQVTQVAQVTHATQVGFVVPRSVGGSVVRHRVARQLRALCAARLDRLPVGARLVVRALPPAAGATSDRLSVDLDHALATATHKAEQRAARAAAAAR